MADHDAKQALRARLGLPRDKTLIGIVATLRSWKGHRFLIEAFARLARADAHLLIVGDGPQREALTGMVAGLKLAPRVTLAGHQADELPWLQAIDIFALPSYANEGVPQAILQAFACGLPVVTTAAGAIGEVARDGETALVVRMHDVADLVRALDRLGADGELAAAIASRASALVREHHGMPAMLDRMEAVFQQAVKPRPDRGPGA